jgi:hypothetical protein
MTIHDPFKYVYGYLGASGRTPVSSGAQYIFYERDLGIYIYEAFLGGRVYRKEILEQDLLSCPELVVDMIRIELTFLA